MNDVREKLIANGVTFATDNNVGDKIHKLLVKSDPISEEKMRELLNGPAIFHTGTESIVPIYPYEWIPVTERLPDTAERVLVCKTWNGRVYKPEYGYYQDFPNRNGCWYVLTEFGYYPQREVTHWMPLPAPPKGE